MAREEEFRALVEATTRLVSSAIRRVLGRRHSALLPDVTQEVYLAVWGQLQKGKNLEHPTSYIYKVALSAALAAVRKEAPEMRSVTEEAELEQVPAAALDGLQPAEQSALLAQVLDLLPVEERRAVNAYLAGFGHEEVAALYGWTASVARHRIYRGIESLKRHLARDRGKA